MWGALVGGLDDKDERVACSKKMQIQDKSAKTIVPYLRPKWTKSIPCLRPKWQKNDYDTLWGHTYLL